MWSALKHSTLCKYPGPRRNSLPILTPYWTWAPTAGSRSGSSSSPTSSLAPWCCPSSTSTLAPSPTGQCSAVQCTAGRPVAMSPQGPSRGVRRGLGAKLGEGGGAGAPPAEIPGLRMEGGSGHSSVLRLLLTTVIIKQSWVVNRRPIKLQYLHSVSGGPNCRNFDHNLGLDCLIPR
jgi:hypothetical protein